MGKVISYGNRNAALKERKVSPVAPISIPELGQGPQPEWLGKKVLAALGVRTPAGELARSADAAVSIADRIGYPVAMKAQAAQLAHKTEAGGVALGVADERGRSQNLGGAARQRGTRAAGPAARWRPGGSHVATRA